MIRYRDTILEDYFIDPLTAIITDKNGVVQNVFQTKAGYKIFKGLPVHKIQMHTNGDEGYVRGLVIHHVDEDKLNNALSNLKYITRSEHTTLHHKGKALSPEAAAKARIANLGKHPSKEAIDKTRQANLGSHRSEETRLKMSEKRKSQVPPTLGKHWTWKKK